MNGRAAFAPKPEDFIRALPDSGRVFIRALTATGENKDTNFVLSGVTEIREKIGRVCHRPSMQDEPTGIDLSIEETLNRIAWRRSHAAPCPRPQLPKAGVEKRTWGIAISSTRYAASSWRAIGSRIFGETSVAHRLYRRGYPLLTVKDPLCGGGRRELRHEASSS